MKPEPTTTITVARHEIEVRDLVWVNGRAHAVLRVTGNTVTIKPPNFWQRITVRLRGWWRWLLRR